MPEISGLIQNYLEGSIKTIGKVPIIEEKNITENGTYTAPDGVDGFSPVNVNVTPNLVEQVIISNGTYLPPEGYDGYSKVEVDVPITIMDDITITENGTYLPASYNLDGFDEVVVNVPNTTYLSNNFKTTIGSSMSLSFGVNEMNLSWSGGSDIGAYIGGLQDLVGFNSITFSVTTGTSYYNTIGEHPIRQLFMGITAQPTTGLENPAELTWLDCNISHTDNESIEYTIDLDEIVSDHVYVSIFAIGWNLNHLTISVR